MTKEAEDLNAIYAKWETEDLVRALTIDKESYKPIAIELIKIEIQKRDINNEEIKRFQENYSEEKETVISSIKHHFSKYYLSKSFFFGSYTAAIAVTLPLSIGPLIAGKGNIEKEYLPLSIMGGLFGFYAFVVFSVLIYKMWKAIPAANARTTPEKAIGFLFIPVFNLYWWFPALYGWSQDWNRYAEKSENKFPHISEKLALSIAIFSVLGGSVGMIAAFAGAIWLGSVFAAPNCILIPIFIFKVCDLLNKAPVVTEKMVISDMPIPQQAGPRLLGVISLILGILSILLPYIGFVCGVVAIILARKQQRRLPEPLSKAGLITGVIGTILWAAITNVIIIEILLE
jgi:hypothetical protein